MWREKLGLEDDVKPVGELEKYTGETVHCLQWKILCGTVAVNAFVNTINSNVSYE